MEIRRFHSFDELDKAKFTCLIESGFGKKLVPDYFEYANPVLICLAESGGSYAGAIVVEQIPEIEDAYYLDKIVVEEEAQGQGIGKLLWAELNGHAPKLAWRAKKDNPIIEFYAKQADTVISFPKGSDYIFFFYGIKVQDIQKALEYAINKKPTLLK